MRRFFFPTMANPHAVTFLIFHWAHATFSATPSPNLYSSYFTPTTQLDCMTTWEKEYNELVQIDVERHAPARRQQEFYTALLPENVHKNRYASSVLANEATRVIFKEEPTRYINANHFDAPTLFGSPHRYILTQEPLPHTVNDFWEMIDEHYVQIIVQLNAEGQHSDELMRSYNRVIRIPHGESYMEVRPEEKYELQSDAISHRTYTLHRGGGKDTRQVHHVHFKLWPDRGVPEVSSDVVQVMSLIKKVVQDQRPIVVHCSAGVGRTGTFVASHVGTWLKESGKYTPTTMKDVVGAIKKVRTTSVETLPQYVFAHAVVESL
eukprot:PhF_6_TR30443/c0_g1_i3/m.44698